jgi:2-polyprenyl-3-methyl-5-hydroxy-6-metoxy-1,4-benzoquinol methylase
MQEYFDTNKKLWNAKTDIHRDSEFYDLENFKNGKNPLNKIELDALGEVSGKSLLHLQCHFGQDSLQWARMGAKVTGVDFSPKAVALAQQLNTELGLDAKFVESNVLELDQNLEGKFDIVYTSYGTVGWLPDLEKWAKVISHFLKPGGTFFIADFHPVLLMFDWEKEEMTFPYFNIGEPFTEVEEGTYANRDAPIQLKEYFWLHSLSNIIRPLINHGMQLVDFQEFAESPYNCFPKMTSLDNGMYYYGKKELKIPHVYAIKMKKI